MRINLIRHDCGISNIVQLLNGSKSSKCPVYWKMKGGKSYYGNVYLFTLFGFRLVIDTVKKKDLLIQ